MAEDAEEERRRRAGQPAGDGPPLPTPPQSPSPSLPPPLTSSTIPSDAALANLQREWRLREAKRDEAASRQRKAAAALEAELKSKLVDVRRHGKALIQAEEELSHRAEAEEERAAHERVVLRAQSERETAELQAELAAARATMRSAEAKSNALAELCDSQLFEALGDYGAVGGAIVDCERAELVEIGAGCCKVS